MGRGQILSRLGLLVVLAVGLAMPATVAGQSAAKSDDATWTLPRTPDGHPDLQGVWANNNVTPLERPEAWAGKDRLTTEEHAELQAAAQHAVDDGDALFGDQLVLAAIERTKAESNDPTTGNYNQFWIAERDFNDRTSLVVDPPDGRIPGLTAEGKERTEGLTAHRRDHPADSYTDRPLSDPTTWTRPWTVEIPLRGSEQPVFEYACHEGNIGMEGILSGHRAEERVGK